MLFSQGKVLLFVNVIFVVGLFLLFCCLQLVHSLSQFPDMTVSGLQLILQHLLIHLQAVDLVSLRLGLYQQLLCHYFALVTLKYCLFHTLDLIHDLGVQIIGLLLLGDQRLQGG
jgi:hypothetical protein